MSEVRGLLTHRAIFASGAISAVALLGATLVVRAPQLRALLVLVALAPVVVICLRFALFVNPTRKRLRGERERRKNYTLRGITSSFLVNVRNLNRIKVIAQNTEDLEEVDEMVDEIISEMHALVDRIGSVSGPLLTARMNGARPEADTDARVQSLPSETSQN